MDFDGDGDLDIVRTVPALERGYVANHKPRKVEYFEQATWQHTILWKSVEYRRYYVALCTLIDIVLHTFLRDGIVMMLCKGIATVLNAY